MEPLEPLEQLEPVNFHKAESHFRRRRIGLRLTLRGIRPGYASVALARFLPLQSTMGKFGNSAETLVEILTLCEQTLTALRSHYDEDLCGKQSGQNRRQERRRSTNMVLIRGGLSRKEPQHSAR